PRDVLAMRGFGGQVAELEGRVSAAVLTEVFAIEMERVGWITRWLLRRPRVSIDVAGDIDRYRDGVATLLDGLSEPLPRAEREAYEARRSELVEQGVSESLARRTASVEPYLSVLAIVHLAAEASKSVDAGAVVGVAVRCLLVLVSRRDRIASPPCATRWALLARVAPRDAPYRAYRQVAASVLRAAGPPPDLRAAGTRWGRENPQPG